MEHANECGSCGRVEAFRRERGRLNEQTMDFANKEIKRFFGLDSAAYREGALPARTREMLGLVASFVLRCDDCITYHIIRCYEEGVTDGELAEALNIGLVVGGSITIPHLRRAVEAWNELKDSNTNNSSSGRAAMAAAAREWGEVHGNERN